MNAVFSILLGYALGCVNPAYLIARHKGFDIRTRGSRNAGASNAIITVGKGAGIFTALFDIAKAFAAVRLAVLFFGECPLAAELAGVSCILGHMFPLPLGFHGGKGLACLGGTVLAFDWRVFLALLILEAVLVLWVNYICIVAPSASLLFVIVYLLLTKNLVGGLLYLPAVVAIFLKHLENFRRIGIGTEMHFSYLWNKDAEEARVQRILNEKSETNEK